MDISELPVRKSGGPRVDVDALTAELEDSRLDASTTAGQLADAQRDALELRAQVNRLIDENKTVNDRLDAMLERMIAAEKSRDHWANEWTQMSAWAMDRDIRGDVYRARALALIRRLRTSMQVVNWATPNVQAIIDALETARTERDAAEARLAAQQGAQRYALELRGLLQRVNYIAPAEHEYWCDSTHDTGLACDCGAEHANADRMALNAEIAAALAGTSPHATREEQQSFARSAGQAPTGAETEMNNG